MRLDQNTVQLHARIYVLEHMLQRLWAFQLMATPDPVAAADQFLANYKDALATETFPTADPAQSDLISAEIQEAFEKFLTATKANVEEVQSQLGGE